MIEFTKFGQKNETKLMKVFRDWIASSSFLVECFSKLDHDFSLLFLANEIRKNSFTNWKYLNFLSNPLVFNFPMRIFSADSLINETAKVLMKPIYKSNIGINNKYPRIKSFWISLFLSDIKSPFPIHDPRKINNLFFVHPIKSILFSLRLTYKWTKKQVAPAETKPDGTLIGEVIVRAASKDAEVGRNDLLAA